MTELMALVPREDDEQAVVIMWASMNTAKYEDVDLLFHIPNGGKRNPREAARFRQMGVRAGMPDLCLPVARGIYHALYIEMKRRRGGLVSEVQNRRIKRLLKAGNCVVVCRGADEAIEAIKSYYWRPKYEKENG